MECLLNNFHNLIESSSIENWETGKTNHRHHFHLFYNTKKRHNTSLRGRKFNEMRHLLFLLLFRIFMSKSMMHTQLFFILMRRELISSLMSIVIFERHHTHTQDTQRVWTAFMKNWSKNIYSTTGNEWRREKKKIIRKSLNTWNSSIKEGCI